MWPLYIRNLWQVNYILLMPFLSDRRHSHKYGSDSPGREKWSKYGIFYFGESDPYLVSLSLLSHHCSCSDTNFSWSSEKTFNFFTQAYCRSSVDQCLSFPIYRVTGSALTHLLLDHLSNYSCPSFTHDIRRFDVFVCCCSWRRVG